MAPLKWLGALALAAAATIAACASKTESGFHEDVEPIVQARCQNCHHAGGIAPFSLVTYDEVKGRSHAALQQMRDRTMPPWGAYDTPDCKMEHKFKDDLRLTDAEIDTFARWVANGMPEGNAKDAPPPKAFAPDGLPGATGSYAPIAPYHATAGGKDDFRCYTIDPGFTEDTWISAASIRAGTPGLVHHVLVFGDPDGESAQLADATGSYPCFGGPGLSNPVRTSLVAAWVPGIAPFDYGDDIAMKIPKGSRLVMQVHYHPGGLSQDVDDLTHFELRKTVRPRYVAQPFLIGNATRPTGILRLLPGPDDPPTGPEFLIPANSPAHTETIEFTMPATLQGFPVPPMNILFAGSHMHWAGKDLKLEISRTQPYEGQPAHECLLDTPRYDFNWQRAYEYADVLTSLPEIRANDTLRITCTYDNTMNNAHIRDALAEQHRAEPVDIRLGETTLDEMCLAGLVFVRLTNPFD